MYTQMRPHLVSFMFTSYNIDSVSFISKSFRLFAGMSVLTNAVTPPHTHFGLSVLVYMLPPEKVGHGKRYLILFLI